MSIYMVDIEEGIVFKFSLSDLRYHFCTTIAKFNFKVHGKVGYFPTHSCGE